MPAEKMDVSEAAERMLGAVLVEFADLDDDAVIPLHAFMIELAAACKVDPAICDNIEEEVEVGEVRRRFRVAREGLARGDLS